MNLIQTNSQQRKDIPVLIEALNFIYDVYSDCEFDYDLPVFVQGNFLKALNQLPSVRAVVNIYFRKKNHSCFFCRLNQLTREQTMISEREEMKH